MLELIKGANLVLRFLLELCALAALAYWGFKTGSEALTRIGLGIGAPLVTAVVWGTFVSPRAPVQLPVLLSFILQALVFGSSAAGLEAPVAQGTRGTQLQEEAQGQVGALDQLQHADSFPSSRGRVAVPKRRSPTATTDPATPTPRR